MTTRTSPSGKWTFAHVDCPDDNWRWAIVSNYEGCQDYDEIIMAFPEEYVPVEELVDKILRLVDAEYP